jgi:hypothetical protein
VTASLRSGGERELLLLLPLLGVVGVLLEVLV